MKKRGFILIVFLLLLVSFLFSPLSVFSEEQPFITHKSKPKINLDFDEPVNILNVDMINLEVDDVTYEKDFFDINYSDENSNVTLTPKYPLDNGLYDFTVLVEDLVNNRITYNKKILVDVPITDIHMHKPRLHIMNKTVGDIVILTREPETKYEKDAHCKYSHLLGYSLRKKFEVANEFDESNSSTHVLYDYNFSIPYNRNFYVICKDEDDRINYEFFKLDYDLEKPKVDDVSFDPPMMITLDNNFTLNVTTNEDTFCFFNFLDSRYYFNNQTSDDEFSINSYSEKHSTYLYDVLPSENGDYYFNLFCQDRAFWGVSELLNYTVDLSAALKIYVREPSEYISDSSFVLDIFTNKPSYCQYDFDNFGLSDMTSNSSKPLTNHQSLNELYAEPGKHDIQVECFSESAQIAQRAKLDYVFIMDDSPPDKPVLSGSNFSCTPNRLELEATSNDNESGIDYYMYMVEEFGSNKLINWTKSSSGDIVIDDETLNTTDEKKYYVTVEAYNRAGLKSQLSTKVITYDETGDSCDSFPPIVDVNTSFLSGSTYVTLNCTDDSGQCVDMMYGLSEYENQCIPDMAYYSKFVIDKNYFLCYRAYDPAGNMVNETVNVSVFDNPDNSSHCFNGVFEPELNETDVDCGGPCFGCSLGATCSVNSDCSSKFCMDGVCTAPSCNDTYKNGKETDVDCGGDCVNEGFLCSVGESCLVHGDCESGFCGENYTCSDSGCSDGVRNANETDVDCGGLSCKGCDIDLNCRIDEDCKSNFCDGGKCEDYKLKDCDGDGLPDYWEKKYFDCSPDSTGCYSCTSPGDDKDGDGLDNLEEYELDTNPVKKDTDGDGYSDGDEVESGYDPLDPDDHPTNWLFLLLVFFIMLILSYLTSVYTFDYFKPIRDEKNKKYLADRAKKEKEEQIDDQKSNLQKQQSTPLQQNISIKKKPKKKKTKKKEKPKVSLAKEKERGKIFNAFEGEKTNSAADEYRRELARRLKTKKKRKKKHKVGKTSGSQNSNNSKNAEMDELTQQDRNKVQGDGTNLDELDNILNKNSTQDLMKKVINKDKDYFDELSKIGKNDSAFDRLAQKYDRQIKKSQATAGEQKEKSKLDELDSLINKNKNDEDFLSKIQNRSKKRQEDGSGGGDKEIMEKFAQSLQSGQGIEMIKYFIKKLLDEGKINKDDIRHLLMEMYMSGKLSGSYYDQMKKELSL
ncbi:MAG: thrombospondin type 3 repeat-containing protein [Thermoplasmatota archaeon]